MTTSEKQVIAATARKLILLLNECDDPDYVQRVVDCVVDGAFYSAIDPHFM